MSKLNHLSYKKKAEVITQLAIKSILYEVSCTPKPGLIDRKNTGAHDDMDYFTFLDSIVSLIPFFYKLVEAGVKSKSTNTLLLDIREIGKKGEEAMFSATNNINTQKGLLFSIGTICAAAGVLIKNNQVINSDNIKKIIIKLSKGLIEKELKILEIEKFDDRNTNRLTHGQKMYLKYRATGIRGEVEGGFETVFKYGLPSLKRFRNKGLNFNDSLVNTLIELMLVAKDTNVLSRTGDKGLKIMNDYAVNALKLGGIGTKRGSKFISKMDKDFKENNISPGGVADLLAVTVLFYFIDQINN